MRPARRVLGTVVAALFSAVLAVASCTAGTLDLLPGSEGGHAGEGARGGGGRAGTGGGGGEAVTNGGGGAGGASCSSPDCPCGKELCFGACVDNLNDPLFCGSCDTGCKHNQVCKGGSCECLPGFELCDGSCFFTGADPNHCGSCTNVCHTGERCEEGTCLAGDCSGALTGCTASDDRLFCVDLASSSPFCGSCGTICGPTQVCAGSACQDFVPATPCSACPCDAECADAFGAPVSCCPGIAGASQPICVKGSHCP